MTTAIAHANIALVKYWGKADTQTNAPAVGSLSLTLSKLWTRTTVNFRGPQKADRFYLNDRQVAPHERDRLTQFIDEVRRRSGIGRFCEVRSINSFPTAAGLASSASGYAALAMAAMHAAGKPLPPEKLSSLARLGSGSAARSIHGGFAELPAGGGGQASGAIQIADKDFWPLAVLVAITDGNPKKISSRDAMEITQRHSPYYSAWVDSSVQDLEFMRAAVLQRDFDAMGALAEHSALKMHGLIMSTRPGLIYWNPGTVAVMQEVLKLRQGGVGAYFTIDAGPQVKVLCRPHDRSVVAERLLALPEIHDLTICAPGPSAHIVEET
ncbi:MAG: diphosphomevalonate decarboxylase [Desulfobacterales bacterium]|nr:diphosphomevalonate decarboxylase [Desulfobacterales bacterium]